jgi:aromatic-amino-acid transaminase
VQNYRYYDAATHDVNRAGMLEDLNALPNGSIVVLHACCHNPTGVDLSPADWKTCWKVKAKGHVPFLDMAYQGFGDGIDEDAAAVRLFAESGLTFFVSSSFSKSFSLYGERVGALSIVSESKEEKRACCRRSKRVIRTNYSNPPTHGASIAAVLNSPELRAQWEAELAEMRLRIRGMRSRWWNCWRKTHRSVTSACGRQRGMFSYSGLTVEQVHRLRTSSASTPSTPAASAWPR